MSESAFPDFEWIRKHAKQLHREIQAGDAAALARVRALPGLATRSDADLIASVRLADVQQAIAREHGSASWAALRAAIESATPAAAQVERLLDAVRRRSQAECERIAAQAPGLASEDGFAATVLAEPDSLARWIAREPALPRAERGGEGWTALLHLAASPLAHARAEQAAACAELLLRAGADVHASMPYGEDGSGAPLRALYFASEAGDAPLVRVLLAHGAKWNDGESVYHAAEYDRREVLALLLEYGADFSTTQAPYGNTPLFFIAGHAYGTAAHDRALNGMRWLLEHGADPNVPSGDGGSRPLHHAVHRARSLPMAEALLSHGAEVDARDHAGRSALEIAVALGHPELEALLLAHGADGSMITPMHRFLGACMRGEESEARTFLEQHPGLMQALPREARSLAAQAAHEGRAVAVRTLLAMGWDIAWEGAWGGTPLHHAAWRGDVALVRDLLERAAPLDLRDSQFGSSPLAWAAHGSRHCRDADEDYSRVITMLLDAGSGRAEAFNRWGEAPESLASRRIAALLRARGFAPDS